MRDVWDAIKQENFVFGFRSSRAIQVYSDMQYSYDDQIAILRKSFAEEAWKYEGSSVNDALQHKDINLAIKSYQTKVDTNFFEKMAEKGDELIENMRKFASQSPDPELATGHLSSFQIDVKKKIHRWLENEKARVCKKIKSLLKKETSGREKQAEFQIKFLARAREIAVELRGDGSAETLDEAVISNRFEQIFKRFLKDALDEDNSTFGKLDRIYYDILE